MSSSSAWCPRWVRGTHKGKDAALGPALSSMCATSLPPALWPAASPKTYGHLLDCKLPWFLKISSPIDPIGVFRIDFPWNWWFSICHRWDECSSSGTFLSLQKYVQIGFGVLISPCLSTKNAFRQPLKVIQITVIEMESSKIMNIVSCDVKLQINKTSGARCFCWIPALSCHSFQQHFVCTSESRVWPLM